MITELVITMILMVVMSTAGYEKAPGGAAQSGVAIGLWIGAAIYLAVPISGGSMNPARTLGPDIVALSFHSGWVYVLGPVLGALLGAWLWTQVLGRGDKEVLEATG